VLTKVFGSTNPINVVKATFTALEKLRTIRQIEETRGVMLREAKVVTPPPAAATGEVKA
jgi:ribosomal protein S5